VVILNYPPNETAYPLVNLLLLKCFREVANMSKGIMLVYTFQRTIIFYVISAAGFSIHC